jgi:hypothetical protein
MKSKNTKTSRLHRKVLTKTTKLCQALVDRRAEADRTNYGMLKPRALCSDLLTLDIWHVSLELVRKALPVNKSVLSWTPFCEHGVDGGYDYKQ